MPTGAPFNSFTHLYPIRVDDFATLPPSETRSPSLHLLTHTHSDHVNGLAAKSFGHKVVCSIDAKHMLLNYEPYHERNLHDLELRAEKQKVFRYLKIDKPVGPMSMNYYPMTRDLLDTIPLNTPTPFELSEGLTVHITAIDANHCPGAVMYLIEGKAGAVLHTGDFRAEPCFIDSVKRNPFLQPYLAPKGTCGDKRLFGKRLEAIHLDTASVLSLSDVPTKESGTDGLIQMMTLYPTSVHFFLNTWTWGYEDIVKAISREFDAPIHFDRYKSGIYTHLKNDPLLSHLSSRKDVPTRFHACERFNRCPDVAMDDVPGEPRKTHSITNNRVVYINPVSMSPETWKNYLAETRATISTNYRDVHHLLVPISRHSPLPELKNFVSLFKPRRMIPNTLIQGLHGFDWKAMDQMFADCVTDPSSHLSRQTTTLTPIETDPDDIDVSFKNLIGDGAEDVAKRWAEDGKMRAKLCVIKPFLEMEERKIVDHALRISKKPYTVGVAGIAKAPRKPATTSADVLQLSSSPPTSPMAPPPLPGRIGGVGLKKKPEESQETDFDSDCDDEDAKERTMQFLMGYIPEGRENLEPSQEEEEEPEVASPQSTPQSRRQLIPARSSKPHTSSSPKKPSPLFKRVQNWMVTVPDQFSQQAVEPVTPRISQDHRQVLFPEHGPVASSSKLPPSPPSPPLQTPKPFFPSPRGPLLFSSSQLGWQSAPPTTPINLRDRAKKKRDSPQLIFWTERDTEDGRKEDQHEEERERKKRKITNDSNPKMVDDEDSERTNGLLNNRRQLDSRYAIHQKNNKGKRKETSNLDPLCLRLTMTNSNHRRSHSSSDRYNLKEVVPTHERDRIIREYLQSSINPFNSPSSFPYGDDHNEKDKLKKQHEKLKSDTESYRYAHKMAKSQPHEKVSPGYQVKLDRYLIQVWEWEKWIEKKKKKNGDMTLC